MHQDVPREGSLQVRDSLIKGSAASNRLETARLACVPIRRRSAATTAVRPDSSRRLVLSEAIAPKRYLFGMPIPLPEPLYPEQDTILSSGPGWASSAIRISRMEWILECKLQLRVTGVRTNTLDRVVSAVWMTSLRASSVRSAAADSSVESEIDRGQDFLKRSRGYKNRPLLTSLFTQKSSLRWIELRVVRWVGVGPNLRRGLVQKRGLFNLPIDISSHQMAGRTEFRRERKLLQQLFVEANEAGNQGRGYRNSAN